MGVTSRSRILLVVSPGGPLVFTMSPGLKKSRRWWPCRINGLMRGSELLDLAGMFRSVRAIELVHWNYTNGTSRLARR